MSVKETAVLSARLRRWIRPRFFLVIFVATCSFSRLPAAVAAESVDVRTYVEMTRSVAEHGVPYFDNGVPYFDNGPVDRFIALRSPFNLYAHGHLWGIYGPAYAYFAAVPFRLGGLVYASIATCLLLVPLALVTFFMTRRLLRRDDDDDAASATNEWYSLASALLIVVSTPALGKSLEL